MRPWLLSTMLAVGMAAVLASCEPTPPEPPPGPVAGAMCGGLQGLACGAGEYCAYPVEAQCGAADRTGICMPRPEACTMEYVPVCGCDGETYSSACAAASAGVSVAQQGLCG